MSAMIEAGVWAEIEARIAAASGARFHIRSCTDTGGGCINRACVLEGDGARWFVKLNHPDRHDMFEAEAYGLKVLAAARALRVPSPLCWGVADGYSFLVLEHVEFGPAGSASEEQLGRGLAALHRVTHRRYGWWRDNTIGATTQPNAELEDWCAFYASRRLSHQLALAERNGHGGRLQGRGETLLVRLSALLDGHRPAASLLHGDLWGGNWAVDRSGAPVVFDPAVYHGDREADLAMTELFGGFGARFHAAYREAWPVDAGYTTRRTLYNLYHVLNHLNLFGGAYRAQAEDMIERLLAEC
jgi:fructosamine-3-kinase